MVLTVVLSILLIVILVMMWPLTLFGHALGMTPSWHQLWNRNHVWMHHHYPLVGLRYLGATAIDRHVRIRYYDRSNHCGVVS